MLRRRQQGGCVSIGGRRRCRGVVRIYAERRRASPLAAHPRGAKAIFSYVAPTAVHEVLDKPTLFRRADGASLANGVFLGAVNAGVAK